jgi:hypothetical protein
MTIKSRENRARRLAARQGQLVVKGRTDDTRSRYVLVDDCKGNRVGRYGGQAAVSQFLAGWDMSLDQLEQALG